MDQMEFFSVLFGLVTKVGFSVLVLLIAILLALYYGQNNMLYIPNVGSQSPSGNPNGFRLPSEQGLDYEDVTILTKDDIKLKGWFLKRPTSYEKASTIVFFHENAGNIGTRLQYLNYYLRFTPFNVLIVAYRGYSDSQGIPTEKGLQLDADAVLNYIFNKQNIDKSKIFIHGRSLGGAVAIYAQSHLNYNVAGLILEVTFTSISDMVDVMFYYLSFLKPLVLRIEWNSIKHIPQIKIPILFIFALKDEIVPAQHMAELYNAASGASFKEKLVIEDGTHNGCWTQNPRKYFESITSFSQRVLQK